MYDGVFINPLFVGSFDNDQIEPNDFTAQHDQTFSHVHTDIFYAASGFRDICKIGNDEAPSPLVSISKNFIQNDIGITTAVEDTVNIEGYIIPTGIDTGAGPDLILTAASGLEKVFTDNPVGKLEIKCGPDGDGEVLYALDSARPMDLNLDKTQNNWTQYLKYNVTFIGINSGLITGAGRYPVKNTVDTWSIEPVSDLVNFEHITMNAKIKTGGSSTANKSVHEYNLPKFKVTHTVAANGIRSKNDDLTGDTLDKVYRNALENAGKWVSGRLEVAETGAVDRGIAPRIEHSDKNQKYDFVRSVNYDLSTALYQVVDTWFNMPSGSLFTEEYSIEVSTNEKYQKTIRVNGTIQGNVGVLQSFATTGLPNNFTSGQVKLEDLGGEETVKISGNLLAPHSGNTAGWSEITSDATTRFDNASRAWHGSGSNKGGIKNLLLWRASTALNASQAGIYTETFIPTSYNRFSTTNNPINSKESLLNPIPISTSETFDPKKGIVSYSYEFNNKLSAISGALTESISINDTGPSDVLAEVFVLGRKLGPVLQNLGAKTTTTRDVNIELTVMPPTGFNGYFMTQTGCPLYTGGSIYGLVSSMVSGLRPFGPRDASVFPGGNREQINRGQVFVRRDDQSWNPAEGRYTRSISWAYQQCNTSNSWDDI
tara:strand:+ start:1935 stop:3899 length:1965 start_codon:yes stop_codon:yes gene_type:complete